MEDERLLLFKVINGLRKNDYVPLLVYADWLEERAHPLADFIRLCKKMRDVCYCDPPGTMTSTAIDYKVYHLGKVMKQWLEMKNMLFDKLFVSHDEWEMVFRGHYNCIFGERLSHPSGKGSGPGPVFAAWSHGEKMRGIAGQTLMVVGPNYGPVAWKHVSTLMLQGVVLAWLSCYWENSSDLTCDINYVKLFHDKLLHDDHRSWCSLWR